MMRQRNEMGILMSEKGFSLIQIEPGLAGSASGQLPRIGGALRRVQ